ncbi:MAG: bifunctional metallophosphatase/5'-nucleotidase [Limnobacter sp.]|nr:bifunctional metallophosphatase/5'-nucleotidase [Limnobacter sp.]
MQFKKQFLAGSILAVSVMGLSACLGGGSGSDNPATTTGPAVFSLQVLHFADMDGDDNVALNSVANLSGLLNQFRSQMPNNTLVVSSGDNYIPGPRLSASEDPTVQTVLRDVRGSTTIRTSIGRADMAFLDAMAVQASAVGNHELDLGTSEFRTIFAPDVRSGGTDVRWNGAQFPYLSFNADFSKDSNLNGALNGNATPIKANGAKASDVRGGLTGWVTAEVAGQTIGIIGASSPTFPSITSTGGITFEGGAAGGAVDIDALAASIQRGVDQMTAAGINKIVLLAHMQQIRVEEQLAERLRNVDIIVAGGSNARLGNTRLRPGEASQGQYPKLFQSPTNMVALVNVDGDYKYLGRLIAPFDADGKLVASGIDRTVSDAYATSTSDTAGGVTPNANVVKIRDALKNVIASKDGNVFGNSAVYLDGRRTAVRTEETNLGNLTADANLAYAQLFDPGVQISLKNGGGLRSDIGFIETQPGSTTTTFKPIAANPGVRAEGAISQLSIENSLRFNNQLVVVSVTAQRLKELMEHGVAATAAGATPGQFPQVGGFSFSFDPARAARTTGAAGSSSDGTGQRIRSLKVGNDVVVQNGVLVGDPNRTFKMVTLNFLADIGTTGVGGDSYPFQVLAQQSRLNLASANPIDSNAFTSANTFAAKGGEQDALARFLRRFTTTAKYNLAETPVAGDTRIQNLSARNDTVLQ